MCPSHVDRIALWQHCTHTHTPHTPPTMHGPLTVSLASQGYYRRTADYFPTKNRQRVGCFALPMVYAAFLIDLQKDDTAKLAFHPPHANYTWPFDDIIVFAYSCQSVGESSKGCVCYIRWGLSCKGLWVFCGKCFLLATKGEIQSTHHYH